MNNLAGIHEPVIVLSDRCALRAERGRPRTQRDFASELPAPGKPVDAEIVWRHIEGRLKMASLGDFAPYLREELLTRGGLILLDGLDEVPDPSVRREQIKEALRGFSDTFNNCRYLVTSRTYAYTRQDWKLGGFAEVALLPFSVQQVRRFVDVWYAHMVELDRLSKFDADGRADLLKQTINRNPCLAELAVHPLLLTLIARLHTEKGGSLPEKREELYAQAVEHLLTEWERAARGMDGRPFPWGEDCANTSETGIGEPCTVGLFPKGRSEDGCFDMAGNLWEWTRSLWGKDFLSPEFAYPYDPKEFERENPDAANEIYRVVRGGSWRYGRVSARCACRSRYPPGDEGAPVLHSGFVLVFCRVTLR